MKWTLIDLKKTFNYLLKIFRRPRGRPATAPEWAQVDEYDSSNSSNDMSSDEKQYKRMRDLNNAASKRCRVGRKRKSQVRFLINFITIL